MPVTIPYVFAPLGGVVPASNLDDDFQALATFANLQAADLAAAQVDIAALQASAVAGPGVSGRVPIWSGAVTLGNSPRFVFADNRLKVDSVTTGPSFSRVPRLFQSIDGSFSFPITGQTILTPSAYIERFDASVITGTENVNAFSTILEVVSPGRSDAPGGFNAIAGLARTSTTGTGSGNQSVQAGGHFAGFLYGTANFAAAFGLGSFAVLEAGIGASVSAFGLEAGIHNDCRNADFAVGTGGGTYANALLVTAGGAFNSTVGIWLHEAGGASGKFRTGIFVEGLVDPGGGEVGSGLVLCRRAHNTAPYLEWRNSHTESPAYLTLNGEQLQLSNNDFAVVFSVAMSTGSIQIIDSTKAFPMLASVAIGTPNSGDPGFRVLQIPN